MYCVLSGAKTNALIAFQRAAYKKCENLAEDALARFFMRI
jgi:hypothetical protein